MKSESSIIGRRQGGFTMVELAIVLVIAGIILTAVLKGTDMINKAKIERVTADLKGMQGMLLEHEKRTGRLPGDCDENGIIEFTAFTQNAIDNNSFGYNTVADPDGAGRCDTSATNEGDDANRVWSDLRKANIVDPTRTNINLTKNGRKLSRPHYQPDIKSWRHSLSSFQTHPFVTSQNPPLNRFLRFDQHRILLAMFSNLNR